MPKLFQWFVQQFSARRACRTQPQRQRCLRVEGLETRRLLSVSAPVAALLPALTAHAAPAAASPTSAFSDVKFDAEHAAHLEARLDHLHHDVRKDHHDVVVDKHDLHAGRERIELLDKRMNHALADLAADTRTDPNPVDVAADQARILSLDKRLGNTQLDVTHDQHELNRDRQELSADRHKAHHVEHRLDKVVADLNHDLGA
jgi:hypothetical protein